MSFPLQNSKCFFYITIDLEANYTYFNDYYHQSFNRKNNIEIGKPCDDNLIEESKQSGWIAFKKITEGDSLHEKITLKKVYANGSEGWSEWEFSGLYDINKTLIGATLIGHNIPDYLDKVTSQSKYNDYLLQAFAKGSNAEISLKDENFRYIMSNDALAVYLKVPISEIYLKTDEDFYHPDIAKQTQKTDKKAQKLKLGEQMTCEVEVDGEFYSSQKFPVLLENNKIGVGCITLNVTPLKQNQNQIVEKEQFINNLTDNVDGILTQIKYSKDRVPAWEFASKGINELFGVDFEELQKNPFAVLERMRKNELELIFKKMEVALKNNATNSYQHQYFHPNGSTKWIDVKAVPKKQKDGSIIWYGFHTDITEKKMLELENNQNQDFLSNLTNNVNGVLTHLRIDENFGLTWQFLSKGIEKLYEVTFEDAKKDPLVLGNMIHPDDEEFVMSEIYRNFVEIVPFANQHRIITPSGVEKWVEINSIPKKMADNSVIWYGFHQDITARKKLELENKKNQKLLNNITNNVNGVLTQMRINKKNQISWDFVSKGVEKIYGLSLDEAKKDQKITRKLIHPEDFKSTMTGLISAYKALKPFQHKFRIITKQGIEKWIEINSIPKKQKNGEIVWNGFHQDITNFKNIELEKEKNKNLLSDLTKNLNGALTQIRYFEPDQPIWEYFSKGFEDLYETDRQSILTNPLVIREMLDAQNLPIFLEGLKNAEKNINNNFQCQITTKKGTKKWIEINVFAKEQSNGSTVFHSFHQDITEKKEVENKIKNNEKFLQNLTDNINGVITQFRFAKNGAITCEFLSKGVEEIYGTTFEESKQNPLKLLELMHPEESDKLLTQTNLSIEKHQALEVEFQIKTPGGIQKWVKVNSVPKLQDNGDVVFHGFHQDITEKKIIEDKVSQNQKFLQNLTDNINGVITQFRFTQNREVTCEFLSKGVEEIYGISAEDAQKNPLKLYDLIKKEDAENLVSQTNLAVNNKTLLEVEFEITTPTGKNKWVLFRTVPKFQENGDVIFHGFHQDITEKKIIENKVSQNEKFLQNLTDNVNGVITKFRYTKEGDTICEFLSKGVEDIYEITFEALINNPFKILEMVQNNDAEKVVAQTQKAYKLLQPLRIEYQIKTPSGTFKWIKINSIPRLQEDGDVIWHGFHEDITVLKDLELQNLKNQELLKNLTNNVNGILSQFSAKSRDDYQWDFVSKGVEKIYEISAEEVLADPKKLTSFFVEEDLKRIQKLMNESFANLTPLNYQFQIKTPSGIIKWLEVTSVPSKQDDGSVIWHAFDMDITEKKAIERQIELNEKFLINLTNNVNGMISQLQVYEDETLKWNFLSKGVQNLYGVSIEEVHQNPTVIHAMIHPDDKFRTRKEFVECWYHESLYFSQHRIITPNGQEKWIEVNSMPQKSKDGSVVWHGFHVDITNQKKLQLESEKNQVLLKKLSDNVNGVLTQFTAINDTEFRWDFMSKGAKKMYEIDPEKALKNPSKILKLIDKKDFEMIVDLMTNSCKNLTVLNYQFRMKTPSGISKWIEVNSVPQKNVDGTVTWHGFHLDITNQKKLQLENETKDETLKKVAKNINGVLSQFRVTPLHEQIWEYLSDKVLDIFEVTFEEAKNDPQFFEKLVYPTEKTRFDENMYKSFVDLTPVFQQHRIVTKSGIVKWIETSSIPERQEDKSVIWHSFHQEITEQKKLELKNKENQILLKNLTNNVNGVLAQFKMDDKRKFSWEFLSKGVEKIYETSFEQVKANQLVLNKMINPLDSLKVYRDLYHSFTNQIPVFNQHRITTPSGIEKWVEINYMPQKINPNDVTWFGFISDITNQKQLEIQNQKNQEQIDFIVNNAVSALMLVENNQFTYISKNYESLFGFTAEEENYRILNNLSDLCYDELDKTRLYNQIINAVKKQDKSMVLQFRFLHKNGSVIWRQDKVSIFYDQKGYAVRFVDIVSDISQTKILERLIEQKNQQLANEVIEKEKIANNFVSFQKDKWLEISENLHDNISQILFAANLHLSNVKQQDASLIKANSLIKLALDEIKYITEGTKSLVIQDKGFQKALSELIANNNFLNNIKIHKKIEVGILKHFSNSEQIILFTIIQEALQNAIKHSGGSKIDIVLGCKDKNYFVSITDNGKGLAENYVNGMGVYNIQKNVDLLNGKLQLLSKKGLQVRIDFEENRLIKSLKNKAIRG